MFREKKNYKLVIISIFITALLYFIAAIPAHYNPFFKGSILAGDLNQQYLSFFSYYKHALTGKESLIYSFSNGLGGNMIGNWAYYLMSPFNLILLLFSNENMPTAVFLIIWLKIAISSGTMAFFLQAKNQNIRQVYIIILSVSYALMGFVVVYQFNLMWLDGIILLPIITSGIERIIMNGKVGIYIFGLAVGLISNYYMGFMLCVSSVIYFLYAFIVNNKSDVSRIKTIVYYAVSSILSGALAAFILLPTYANLSEGKLGIAAAKLPILMDNKPWLFFSKMVVGSPSTGLPLIYVSSFVVMAFIGYFFNKKITLSRKIITLCFTFVVISGLIIGPVYLMWHGFQMPQGYPYRFTFIITFWMIMIAAEHLNSRVSLSKINGLVLLIGVSFLSCYLLTHKLQFNYITNFEIILSSIGLIIATVVLLDVKSKRLVVLLSAFFLAETMVNIVKTESIMPTKNPESYENYIQDLKKLNTSQKKDANFRIEKSFMRANDRGEAYQYANFSASSFSSNFISEIPLFYQKMGVPAYGYWAAYVNGTKVTDSLLGIKQFISSDLPTDEKRDRYNYGLRDDLKFNKISEHEYLHKNKLALSPFGYTAQNLGNTSKMHNTDPLENQNKIVQQLTGMDTRIFKKTKQSPRIEKVKANKISYTFENLKHNQTYYLLLNQSLTPNNVWININKKDVELFPAMSQPVPVGVIAKNGKIQVDLNFKRIDFSYERPQLYTFDESVYRQAMTELNQSTLKVETFKSTDISGRISVAGKKRYLITSIPNEKGWQLYVDNKKASKQTALGAFIGVKLDKGKHKIEFRYRDKSLEIGSIISGASLLIVLLFLILEKYRRRNVRKIN